MRWPARVADPAIVVVEHQPTCPPAWLGEWLRDEGLRVHVVRPYAAQPLPTAQQVGAAYRGVVVLGGSMGAGDDDVAPWLPAVRELLRACARTGLPALGVCLGHQLAAFALGGRVERHPGGITLGLQAVGWTEAAANDPLLGKLAGRAVAGVQWNDDVVTVLPPDAVALARGGDGQLQAARFAPTVWGVQWHPEAGASVVAQWLAKDRGSPRLAGHEPDARLAEIAAAEGELREVWGALARAFARQCRADR